MNKTILLSALAVTLAGAGAVLAAQAPPAQPMSFFITSTTPGGGNLGGLAGADKICQDLAAAVTADGLWFHSDRELHDATSTALDVEVEGRRYHRLAQASSATYHGRWGSHHIEEALYREVGVHNGPTIKPLELRVGIIEHMTPDLARIVGALSAEHSSRAAAAPRLSRARPRRGRLRGALVAIMIAARSDARGAACARDRCERSLGWRRRRARRWLPPRLGLELVDLDPFEQNCELVDVDHDARHAFDDAGRKRKRAALESLVNDRESAARPQDQLDLVPEARDIMHPSFTAQEVGACGWPVVSIACADDVRRSRGHLPSRPWRPRWRPGPATVPPAGSATRAARRRG